MKKLIIELKWLWNFSVIEYWAEGEFPFYNQYLRIKYKRKYYCIELIEAGPHWNVLFYRFPSIQFNVSEFSQDLGTFTVTKCPLHLAKEKAFGMAKNFLLTNKIPGNENITPSN